MDKHTKGAIPAQKHDDQDSPGAKKMRKDLKVSTIDPITKAIHDIMKGNKAGPKKAKSRPGDKADGDRRIINKQTQKENVELSELSKKTLGRYVKKASADKAKHDNTAGRFHSSIDHNLNSGKGPGDYNREYDKRFHDGMDKAQKKADKRGKGIKKAVNKLTKEDIDMKTFFEFNETLGNLVEGHIEADFYHDHEHDHDEHVASIRSTAKKFKLKVSHMQHDGPGGGATVAHLRGKKENIVKFHNHHHDDNYSADNKGYKEMHKDYGYEH